MTHRDIVEQTKAEFGFREYPYKPDLIIGYRGQKIAIFVLNGIESYTDSYKALGDV